MSLNPFLVNRTLPSWLPSVSSHHSTRCRCLVRQDCVQRKGPSETVEEGKWENPEMELQTTFPRWDRVTSDPPRYLLFPPLGPLPVTVDNLYTYTGRTWQVGSTERSTCIEDLTRSSSFVSLTGRFGTPSYSLLCSKKKTRWYQTTRRSIGYMVSPFRGYVTLRPFFSYVSHRHDKCCEGDKRSK